MRPLAGVRVVDLTHALAGPFCTHQLRLLGADVVKVEPPGGDDFRERPTVFLAINAGKRSITLDLKTSAGQEVLRRLVADADVLVENFRPGVAEQLGVAWESLHELNPRLIYCSITGYGASGPLRDYPAIEWSVQAMSGMTASYVPEDADGRRLGLSVLDPFSGYVGFSAILAALLQRGQAGQGTRLDVAMLDAALVLMTPMVVSQLRGEPTPGQMVRPTMARFRAQDRTLFIAALHRRWFERLCRIVGAPELIADPRFADPRSQAQHAEELTAQLERRLATRPAVEWETELVGAGIPASVVRTVVEIVDHPHVRERGVLQEVDVADANETAMLVGSAIAADGAGSLMQGGAPRLGEHTEEILSELGYESGEIERLRGQRVI